MSSPGMCIMFAPVLKAEGWISINLQQADILRALQTEHPDLRIEVLQPNEHLCRLPFGKRFSREVLYPRLIRKTGRRLSRQGLRPLLHVADHSYGHLCRAWNPCVVNCNDITHFVRPEITGAALWLWRRRVRTMRHAGKIITISHHLAGEVRNHLHMDANRVTGLAGGVDTAVFRPMPREDAIRLLPQAAPSHPGEKIVLNIGSNVQRKNIPTVLRAIAILRSKGRPVKLVKIGRPLRGSPHEALLNELGISDAVIEPGILPPEKIAAACNAAHVLSFASLYEGFGRPTLEAQACGLPCVLADSSCMREVGGEGALYHAPLDPADLAARLEDALDNESLRDSLIQRGLANVKRFSWKNYAAALRNIYEEVMTAP